MRAFLAAILFCLSAFAFADPSEAHGRHHWRHYHRNVAHHRVVRANNFAEGLGVGLAHMLGSMPSARPADCYGIPWCACWLRHVKGVASRAFNLARNWANWGKPGPAGVGAVVVWPHHVGIITAGSPGHWVVTSGNDGHAVRTRPRSIAGAIAIRWG